MYGIDWSGPIPINEEVDSVEIPPITTVLSEEQYHELSGVVSPLHASDNYGLYLFLATLAYVERLQF